MPKIPEGMEQGSFDMAIGNPESYTRVRAYLIGSFAVHRPRNDTRSKTVWVISHAETGFQIPAARASTLADAAAVARNLEKILNWNLVKRGHSPSQIQGWSKRKGQIAKAALKKMGLLEDPA